MPNLKINKIYDVLKLLRKLETKNGKLNIIALYLALVVDLSNFINKKLK